MAIRGETTGTDEILRDARFHAAALEAAVRYMTVRTPFVDLEVTREPGPMKHGTTEIAFVEDPDGYKIEFIERRPS